MSDIVASIQQFYDEAGVHFSRTRQKTYGGGSANWVVTERYLKLLKMRQSVLDVGCGNGRLVSGLPEGVSYTGTDFSQTLLAEAERLHPSHDFRFGNILEESHWSTLGRYDAIFCVAVLHHIPTKEQQLFVLRQIKQHLAKDGSLYLSVWNLAQGKFAQYRVGDHYEVPYNNKWRRYCTAFDNKSLGELVKQTGLKAESLDYYDSRGERTDILSGQNLVCVARVKR